MSRNVNKKIVLTTLICYSIHRLDSVLRISNFRTSRKPKNQKPAWFRRKGSRRNKFTILGARRPDGMDRRPKQEVIFE